MILYYKVSIIITIIHLSTAVIVVIPELHFSPDHGPKLRTQIATHGMFWMRMG